MNEKHHRSQTPILSDIEVYTNLMKLQGQGKTTVILSDLLKKACQLVQIQSKEAHFKH